jgi:hypothetical protein
MRGLACTNRMNDPSFLVMQFKHDLKFDKILFLSSVGESVNETFFKPF